MKMKFFQVKSVSETFSLIENTIPTFEQTKKVSIDEALGFVASCDIYAKENIPNFRRSTVDGYAIIAADSFGASDSMPAFFTLVGEVLMGKTPAQTINPSQAMYVPTGAMIPEGANAVVMIEYCEDIKGLLNVYKQVAPGENIISIGEDIKEKEVLIKKGTILRASELGALASQGITEVEVYKKPVVGYLSTGDEIVPLDHQELHLGQIRDINGITIGALVKSWGCEFLYGGIVKDDKETFEKAAKEMLEKVDCLVCSGGSSVGTKDYSVEVINQLGKPGVFVHGIMIKPGKPTILSLANNKPIIGLPGHPASAMVIFELFGKAVLSKLQGLPVKEKQLTYAYSTKKIPSAAGRTDYIRVRLVEKDGKWFAEPLLGKSSLISTLVKSDGLLEIDERKEGILKDELVPIRLLV